MVFNRPRTLLVKKKRMDTSRFKRLHPYAQASLGAGNGPEGIRVPPGEDRLVWLTIFLEQFVEECSVLHTEVADRYCTAESCPCMSCGPNYKVLWQDPESKATSEVSAQDYTNNTLMWITETLDREVPQNDEGTFPKDFEKRLRKMFQRLIRVYGHWYRTHLDEFTRASALPHLNTSFRHLYFFCDGHRLTDPKDWAMMKDEIQVIIAPTPPTK